MVVCLVGVRCGGMVTCVCACASSCKEWCCVRGFGNSGDRMVVYECGWESNGIGVMVVYVVRVVIVVG